jgi:hypothetical protein
MKNELRQRVSYVTCIGERGKSFGRAGGGIGPCRGHAGTDRV